MNFNFKQTPNYTPGVGQKKLGFVLHGTLGGYVGAVEWLMTPPEKRNPVSYSSAHIVIGKEEGQVAQLVKQEDVSWHAGIVKNPHPRALACLVKNANGSFVNPNFYLNGIEFVWFPGEQLTDWQYRCAVEFIKASGIKNPLLLSHHDICDYKTDDMAFAFVKINQMLHPTLAPEYVAKQTPKMVLKPVNKFTSQMVFGEQKADVWWLQAVLQYEGCLSLSYKKEGKYDLPTAEAVLKFQLKNKIDSEPALRALSGRRCGPLTINFLNKRYGY